MKFYHRHRTYKEFFYIDIYNGGKNLLKSIVRKLNKIKNEEDDIENKEEKTCFTLIYNCFWPDLLNVNLYSLKNNNSSYIIIYDKEKYSLDKNYDRESIEIFEEGMLAHYLGNIDNKYFFISLKKEDLISDFYVAKDNLNDNLYTIEIKKKNTHLLKKEIKALKILSETNNPYILKYLRNGKGNIFLNKTSGIRPYIIYENAPKFCLFDYLSKLKAFTEVESKIIFRKILQGIKAIHDVNICHRDIKSENILFDEDYNPKIYGFYFLCENKEDLIEFVGTPQYCAPEILLNKPYNGFKCDVFSLGQLLFNIVTGLFGFNSATENDAYYSLILKKEYEDYWNKIRLNNNIDLSQSFKDLYLRMVSYDPVKRPTIDEILNSNWFEENNILEEEQLYDLDIEARQRRLDTKKR